MNASMKDRYILEQSHWFGHMTLSNMEAIAKKIEGILKGHRYTFVSVNEYFGPLPRPEVRTSQKLEPGKTTTNQAINTWNDNTKEGVKIGGFHVADTYGSWGCSTHEGDEKAPYFVFEHGKIIIEQHVPASHKVIWVIALEESREEK